MHRFNICFRFIREVQPVKLNAREFHKTEALAGLFHEFDKKSGYQRKSKDNTKELVIEGLKELKKEITIWRSEWQEHLQCDPIMSAPQPGEVDLLWSFNSRTNFDDWIITSDKDHNEGYSHGQLTLSPTGKGLFSGVLSKKTVKDGKVKTAGYCNFRSIQPTRSFKRECYHDWTMYTHLVLRVRGDGRSYMLNLATQGYFDVMWNDMFNFILFTRGGPHWQVSRIPFSKFFMTSKGRIQDKQEPVPLDRISSFGITAGDQVNGPFRLEIDYIGLEYDPSHREETAYEMYKVPKLYAGY
nr:EOG090X091L [Sida crystallina]